MPCVMVYQKRTKSKIIAEIKEGSDNRIYVGGYSGGIIPIFIFLLKKLSHVPEIHRACDEDSLISWIN